VRNTEFVEGHVYSFAGGTIEHADISAWLIEHLRPAVQPGRTYGSDVLIEMATSSRYADVAVTCDERDRVPGSSTIRHPVRGGMAARGAAIRRLH
jgi:hypothetical protein